MSIFKIIINPDPILRKKSRNISKEEWQDSNFKEFCNNFAQTMIEKDGIGLAAPQIGKNIRLIAINIEKGVLIMINPRIIRVSFAKEWGEEGCLSIPDVFGKVKRHKKIKCKFIDLKGKERVIEASDLMARIIQHEVDHLDGILFIDKAKDLIKNDKKYEGN